jgi:hypothetical protein
MVILLNLTVQLNRYANTSLGNLKVEMGSSICDSSLI